MKTYPLFFGGKWNTSDSTQEVINPANGNVIANVATISRSTVSHVIGNAHEAFSSWRKLNAAQRAAYIHAIADAMEEKSQDIAETITLENGKPLKQSKGEVNMSIDHLRWFAEEGKRTYGRIVPNQADGKRHWVVKQPIGVVAAISPWNFPLVLAVRKIAPALAAGCSVILKPASATPLCALKFAECVETADLPENVFQLVLGSSSDIAAEFLENPMCNKISFTGSTEVGRKLIQGSAQDIKPLSLELGGNAPLIVFEDADIELAAQQSVIAKFRNSSQSCIAANRLFVHQSIYEEFLSAFERLTRELVVADGFNQDSDVGPLINEESLSKALNFIEEAQNKGARTVCGGKRFGSTGSFLEPTILDNVPPDAACMYEETFAPIAPVTSFSNEEEAFQLANASYYGLSAYAFTNSIERVVRIMDNLEAGTIGINEGAPTVSQCPFGGIKHSGYGRELGFEGIEAFLNTKHVSLGSL